MHNAAIALGSNLQSQRGDCTANLQAAVDRVGALGRVTAVSSFVWTAPVGYVDQPDFLNGALLLETELAPGALLRALLAIEQAIGRDRSTDVPAKGPRLIDLDLLLYDELVLEEPGLTVPHPEMHTRGFVLEPLAEIAPDWMHPELKLSVKALVEKLRHDDQEGLPAATLRVAM